MARRRAALGVLGVGILVTAAARLAIPTAPPLYDGVVPIERYVWLVPPAGHPGGAKGATADIPMAGGQSPLVAVATPENEPQAQVFAQPGSLVVPAGARSVKVSIQPIQTNPTEATPTDGHIDGNVYRINVTDDRGTPLTAPASAQVTVVMRGTDPTASNGTIERFSNGSWQPLKTTSEGFAASYLAVVTEFGDFAVVAPGAAASPVASGGPATTESPAPPPSVAAVATPGTSPGPGSPNAPTGRGGGLPLWLLAGVVVVVVGAVVVVGYLATRPRRPKGW
jgi:hypothetical protein